MTIPGNSYPAKPEQDLEVLLERFLHPVPTDLDGRELPTETGRELYHMLDKEDASTSTKGAIVRHRYPYTAEIVDARLEEARAAYAAAPNDIEAHDNYLKAIGLVGAFNFVRGQAVYMHNGTVDRDVAPKMMLSPSAAVQVFELMNRTGKAIGPESKILELYSGTNYFTMFLALQQPERLDCVDLYTPDVYNLPRTFVEAYGQIFAKQLPPGYWPPFRIPNLIQADGRNLRQEAGPLLAEHYDTVFLNPPYGRESTLLIPGVSEAQAFVLWLDSIHSVRDYNGDDFTVHSVVPSQWMTALDVLKQGGGIDAALDSLYVELRKIRYFQEKPALLEDRGEIVPVSNLRRVRETFTNDHATKLEETTMFGLAIHTMEF